MKTTLSHTDALPGKPLCASKADSKNKARLLFIASLLFVFAHRAAGATIEVTNGNDSGPGSLRAAITSANASANADLIKVQHHDIQLLSALPALLHVLEIRGYPSEGAESDYGVFLQTVRRNPARPAFRIFTIAAGATVKISDMKIGGGTVTGHANGGGILNSGNLTLRGCEVYENHARGADSSSGRGGLGRGGGIFNNSNGSLIIDHCAITDNRAEGGSGFPNGEGYGGGIYNLGVLTIRSSTISGNIATGGKGGTPGKGYGGGLFSANAPVDPVLTSCTVSNNNASTGGGLHASQRACKTRSTILAGNSAGSGPECFGSINSEDYNLVGDTIDCAISGQTSHNVTDTPANLGPLANSPGPRYHPLLAGSPAIDSGDDAVLDAPFNITTDQYLRTRQAGDGVDMGAFEQAGFRPPPEDFNGDGNPDFALFQPSDRKTALWYLNGASVAASKFGPTPPAGWALIGCHDFNGDAQSDYLLFRSNERQMAVWFMANATFKSAAFAGPTVPEGWRPVAIAPNIPSGPDLVASPLRVVLVNPKGGTAFWSFDRDTKFLGSTYGPTLPPGWSLVDVADFENDRWTDYLLFHTATRKTAVWHLNWNSFDHSAWGPTAPSGWEVIGLANFRSSAFPASNGYPDYVLFNASTRKTAIWYLDGTSLVGHAYGPTLPRDWQLVSP